MTYDLSFGCLFLFVCLFLLYTIKNKQTNWQRLLITNFLVTIF